MGRPPKVVDISTRKIGKEEKIQRKIQEQALKGDREALSTAPEWLSRRAKAEFDRVVAEASKIDTLDSLDMPALAIYADNYARYIEYRDKLDSADDKQITSILRVMKDCTDAIMRCSIKLGLFATDRLRLIVPAKEEKKVNKFLPFIG